MAPAVDELEDDDPDCWLLPVAPPLEPPVVEGMELLLEVSVLVPLPLETTLLALMKFAQATEAVLMLAPSAMIQLRRMNIPPVESVITMLPLPKKASLLGSIETYLST